tara:strand:+ start:23797 stop:24351 length:555 start_codon:yes stop_codon:yes gene_type:complete
MTLNEKLKEIQVNLKAKKVRHNKFGNYNYRSAEDILEAVKPLLVEHNVTVVVNEELRLNGDQPIILSTAQISDGEKTLCGTALVGVDVGQKGMSMPQRFGAASSYGKKYALGNLFLIDDTLDADATNKHNKKTTTKKKSIKRDTEEYRKALEYLTVKNGDIKVLKANYNISEDVLTELLNLTTN